MTHALELPAIFDVLNNRPASNGIRSTSDVATMPARDSRSPDRMDSLARTIRAVAGGDRDAFSSLYQDYSRMVHAILLGRVPRRDVDDLVQDVFLSAYTRLKELR